MEKTDEEEDKEKKPTAPKAEPIGTRPLWVRQNRIAASVVQLGKDCGAGFFTKLHENETQHEQQKPFLQKQFGLSGISDSLARSLAQHPAAVTATQEGAADGALA